MYGKVVGWSYMSTLQLEHVSSSETYVGSCTASCCGHNSTLPAPHRIASVSAGMTHTLQPLHRGESGQQNLGSLSLAAGRSRLLLRGWSKGPRCGKKMQTRISIETFWGVMWQRLHSIAKQGWRINWYPKYIGVFICNILCLLWKPPDQCLDVGSFEAGSQNCVIFKSTNVCFAQLGLGWEIQPWWLGQPKEIWS